MFIYVPYDAMLPEPVSSNTSTGLPSSSVYTSTISPTTGIRLIKPAVPSFHPENASENPCLTDATPALSNLPPSNACMRKPTPDITAPLTIVIPPFIALTKLPTVVNA